MRGGPGPLLRLVKDQRLAFLLVGGFNTALGTFWFFTIHFATHGWGGELVTLLIAHVLSVPCAFLLYRHLVFRVRGHVLLDLARFELVNLVGLVANAPLLSAGVHLLHMPVLVAQLLATVVIVITNYLAHGRFSFRRAPSGVHPDADPDAQPDLQS